MGRQWTPLFYIHNIYTARDAMETIEPNVISTLNPVQKCVNISFLIGRKHDIQIIVQCVWRFCNHSSLRIKKSHIFTLFGCSVKISIEFLRKQQISVETPRHTNYIKKSLRICSVRFQFWPFHISLCNILFIRMCLDLENILKPLS